MLVQLYENADDNSVTKQTIASELEARRKNNQRFSKEDLFHINKTLNRALTVSFFPNTKSYGIIGNHVTIDIVLTDEELIKLLQNQAATPPIKTYGHLKIKVLAKHDLTSEQIFELEEHGIDTSEVYEVMHI